MNVKRMIVMGAVLMTLTYVLTGCGHEHTWVEATCEEPKHCSECGEVEGEKLTHSWVEATCEEAKHCELCNATEGEALGHDLSEATYDEPPKCKRCGKVVGEKLKSYAEEKGVVFEKLGDFTLVKAQFTMDKETGIIVKNGVFNAPSNISVSNRDIGNGTKLLEISLYEGLADWSYDYASMTQEVSVFDIYTGKTMNFNKNEKFVLPTRNGDINVTFTVDSEDVPNSVDAIYKYNLIVPSDYNDLAFEVSQVDIQDGEFRAREDSGEIFDFELPENESMDRHVFMICE